jgi:ATPase family associated with various cellular activities (AAA)
MTVCTDEPIRTVEKFLAVGTPLIVIDSADHPHTLRRLLAALTKKERAIVTYDICQGFQAGNPAGEAVLAKMNPKQLEAAKQYGPPVALVVAQQLEPGTVAIFDNLHFAWNNPQVVQALMNLREPYKGSRRAILGLSFGATLPADLVQSLSFISDPLPSEEMLTETVCGLYKAALTTELEAGTAKEIAKDLRGTSPFKAEQIAAQSLSREGIDRARLRGNAKKQIDDTPGLSTESARETFDDIGGLDAMRKFLERYFAGPRRPSVVVRIEEIEKALAGATSGMESSGTSGDALGTLLTAMEDFRWSGLLAYGVSGCGKSLVAKAAANQFGARAIRFDLNSCKGSLVGQSEQQIRAAMSVLHAIGGSAVFFIASMNEIASLPPELRRRFNAGTWYFDIPSAAARKDIWQISAKQFGISWDGYDADALTGADIRDICQRAYELTCPCTEAARYHVPLCKSAPDAISKSRADATGRYLDANAGGPYRDPARLDAQYDRSFEALS